MQHSKNTNDPQSATPDAPHRITLLMIMSLLLLPLSGASYAVAVIAIVKSNYSVDMEMSLYSARFLGFGVALAISVYLGLHWYLMIRYYKEITKQLFTVKDFILLYGLLLLNIAVLCLTISVSLYGLPIYMIPIILTGINTYLIYLRRCALHGKPLR